mmetsp:Transcript_7934/g.26924  ORF Transcript_7934/g.26924 Transcript_7934/m.26924 type:complete len:222 (-) Transcript_7934:9-674(-)
MSCCYCPRELFQRAPYLLDHVHEHGDAGEDPLGRGRLGAQACGEHVGGPSGLGLVHGAGVHLSSVELVLGSRTDEEHREERVELLHVRLLERARHRVPARALHEEPVHVGAVPRGAFDLVRCALGHLGHDGELVQGPLVLARRHLHDRREEGLRVEEARDPGDLWRAEVRGPLAELAVALEHVDQPRAQGPQGGPGEVVPPRGHAVGIESRHEGFHALRHG